MARSYDLGRGYTRAQLNRWLAVISRWYPMAHCQRYLISVAEQAGTPERSRSTSVLRLSASTSEKMLAEARTKTAGGVRYVRAGAESLPLIQGSVDMVFISMVFHHFDDPIRAVRECRRVLRAGAIVCLRAAKPMIFWPKPDGVRILTIGSTHSCCVRVTVQ